VTPLNRKGSRFAAAALIAALMTPPAAAGSFRVNPVNVLLASDKGATQVSIANTDTQPLAVRVSALRWTQTDGIDRYEQTHDVIISPPVFTFTPGTTQLIRLGVRTRTPGAAYRLIIEEIPGPGADHNGVRMTLTLNLPLYVLAAQGTPRLAWSVRRGATGELEAEAHNSGARYGQVLSIEARGADGKSIGRSNAMGVVLAGSTRRWSLGRQDATPQELVIQTPQGEVRSPVSVERP